MWLPFLVAFAVATLTAFSYLELVTKYPQAAGAALYTHKAFGIHFVTFLVAFAVICSGITSASTSSNLLATNLLAGFDGQRLVDVSPGSDARHASSRWRFMVLLALINLRGVGESVKFNVVLTLVEMSALADRHRHRLLRDGDRRRRPRPDHRLRVARPSRGCSSRSPSPTSIAFFAMVGFEDSVNMVEETKDPERIFPRIMLTGLGIAVIFYMLVAISVVSVIPEGEIDAGVNDEGTVLLAVVETGAPGLPDRQDLPVPHRASRSPTPR